MPEIIQNWLGTTLGVILDMSPGKFGRNTKDGKLLAKLLYNYGVIPAHILDNVKESKNYYECYNNLILLKPWLKYIGVTYDDSTLQKMAGGEGSAAISLFYAVYLNLERKDRFHYLSAQKERKLSDDSCQKFKVNWVPETNIIDTVSDSVSKLAAPLFEKQDMIEWHRTNCQRIVEQIKRTKAKFEKTYRKKPELGPLVSKHVTSQPLDKKQMEAEEVRGDIMAFEKSHIQESPDLNYSELIELKNTYEMQPCIAPNFSEAKNIIGNIKRRKKGDIYARNFQQKMQHTLLDEQWKEIVEKQDRDFENAVCANLLRQSQYEKQMMKKLYLMRSQKKILTENRRKIELLKIDQCQKEYDEEMQRNMEMRGECWEEEEIEKERIAELHRRLYNEKIRLRRARIKAECRKIFENFTDIAIRISEVRELIGCEIPKAFMKDLKELYFNDLPIFDLLDHLEELYDSDAQPNIALLSECGEEESTFCQNYEYERFKAEEMSRQSILDECDFNDYINLLGPWMVELLFPNGSEAEVRHLVLGYIVHKLLAIKYPPPNVPVRVEIKPMKPTAVVQGLNDETGTNMLMDLMEACKILVVRVNDAINFVLSVYKNELSVVRDIDIAFQKATEDSLKQKNVSEKEEKAKKKVQLLKKESVEKPVEDFSVQHKETQTPRMIPEDDPLLSPNAELGKLAFEALGSGNPVPDPVIVGAIIAYVVSQQDSYDGWILLNYPLLYSQASDLEYFLTGFRILPIVEEAETLEEVEGFSYRGPWKDPFSKDDLDEYRMSRLVPRPDIFLEPKTVVPKTYFDSFIKLKKVPETPHRRLEDIGEDMGPMEKFYSDVEIFFNFEYQNMNFQTMKNLGKTILKGPSLDSESSSLIQKTSLEIFGNVLLELNEKWEPKKKGASEAAGGTKKVLKEPSIKYGSETVEEEPQEENVETKSQAPDVSLLLPKPGDPAWEWATGPQPEGLLLALASLWENMEAIYIEDFKNVFFSLRVHRSNVIGYVGHVRRSIQSLMRRPDEKQKVLCDFQQMFNEIDEDLRPDIDIKCELHVRVSELEQALMSIADERKNNSTKEVMKVAQDGWVPDEMANLVNIFLSALQLEADRCVDSCQVIMDYYTSLQHKIPDEKHLGKVSVPKIQVQDRKYSVLSSTPNKTTSSSSPRNSELKRSTKSTSEQGSKMNPDRLSKTRSLTDKRKRSLDSGMTGAADFLMGILTNLRLPDDGLTPFHNFFIDTVQFVTSEVKIAVEGCFLEIKKSDKPAATTNRQSKTKKASETKIPSSNEALFSEWTTAIENELSRFIFRTQLILARGIFDANEFLTSVLNTLSSLTEEVTDMYLKEIQNISDCCKVFRCGIEEEISIQPLLELTEDEFFVYTNCANAQDNEETVELSVDDETRRFLFTVDQLAVLFQKLQRVAPDGEIVKRSLVYIFEDLRMLKPEVENLYCFPEIWNDIEPDDVTTIMNEVYQDLEIVPWKDFIIYALDLPLPTELDILSMRRCFRAFDPLVTEIINRENYDTITFWFEKPQGQFISDCHKEKEKIEKVKELLYRMYQVNECQTNYSALLLAFCKDENPVIGFTKALALAMGKVISIIEESARDTHSFLGEADDFDYGFFDESTRVSSKKPFCCPTISSEITPKCIPKEKVVRCECKDDQDTSTVENSEKQGLNYAAENEGEDYGYYHGLKPFQRPPISSVIPYNILSCLLKASFPSLPQLSILLDCEQTFQETLNSIYDSTESYGNGIEIHKLLKHKFMHRLLQCTNKFRFVKLKPILMSVAKVNPSMSRAFCIKNRPNVSYCLRK